MTKIISVGLLLLTLSISVTAISIFISKNKTYQCYVRGPSNHFDHMDVNDDFEITLNEWMDYYGRHNHKSWQQCGGRSWGINDYDENGTISWFEYWGCDQDPGKIAEHMRRWNALEHMPAYNTATKNWQLEN